MHSSVVLKSWLNLPGMHLRQTHFTSLLLQKQGLDYTVSDSTVAFGPASIPQAQDVLLASYRVAETSGGAVSAALIPVFLTFVATHAVLLVGGIVFHAADLPAAAESVTTGVRLPRLQLDDIKSQ